MSSVAPPPIPEVQKPRTSGLAIASLICGLAGFLTAGLAGIAAVITGHLAISAINRSGGALGGRGLSIAGLITGYLTICILPIAVLAGLATPVILKNRQAAERTEILNNMKQVGLALFDFDTEYGSRPSDRLAAEIPEFSGLTGPRVLEQLEASGATADIGKLLTLRTVEAGQCWYYFPSPGSEEEFGKSAPPVLISPRIGAKVIIMDSSGSAQTVDPSELSEMELADAIKIPAPLKK